MSRYRKKISTLILGAVCLACLSGCLPEDSFLALRFSPNGRLLAVISEKQGLVIANPATAVKQVVFDRHVNTESLAWTSDSTQIAYAGSKSESLDIFISSLDGLTTRVAVSPARETNPMIQDQRILYLTTESGQSELTSYSLAKENATTSGRLPIPTTEIIKPTLSPDGNHIAAYGFCDVRPQVYDINLINGSIDRITSETDPFGLVPDFPCWTPDSNAVGYLRGEVRQGPEELGNDAPTILLRPAGTTLEVQSIKDDNGKRVLLKRPEGIRDPQFNTDDTLIFAGSDAVLSMRPGQPPTKLAADLSAKLPQTGGEHNEIAFVAASQLIGLTTSSMEKTRIVTFDPQDKFLLAEEYFRSGSQTKSYDLYEELAAGVKRARDPEMAKFIYIANLRRLGRTGKAVAELKKLLDDGSAAKGSVPEKYLWRVLGFSYLLELHNYDKATAALKHYQALTSGTAESHAPDSALNALDILEQTSAPVTRLYARAVKARLDGDFFLTDQLFGDLLTTAPRLPAVQREYMNALDGFDTEVYYFSPSQRPFKPTRSQRAGYLQRFVVLAPKSSPLIREARLNLFLARIEMGSFSRARSLLSEALTSTLEQGRPDGILEVFRNYLETPEPQPWINQAMPEVFLHSDIRPRLEKIIIAPADRLLMDVAETKVALLKNDTDAARRETNTAVAEWNKIPDSKQTGSAAELYGRLLVFRGREAELRSLYSEAAEDYDRAVNLLVEKHVDNFEMQEEIRYRASLLRAFVANSPNMPEKMRKIELRAGVELINPTWDVESLESAVREYLQVYDTTSGTLKQWASYECGVHLSKLGRTYQARSALMTAAADAAPEFLRRKAMMEIAAIDEYNQDPWNAARWYSRMAALPNTNGDTRLWCSYRMAELHLAIHFKPVAAREALAIILSNHPEGPLAIKARELLVSSGAR